MSFISLISLAFPLLCEADFFLLACLLLFTLLVYYTTSFG